MPRAGVLAAALAVLASWSTAAAARPVELTASFDPGARLGTATVLHAELRVDPRRPPATEVRVYYPASLGVLSSGLGLAVCRRPASDFATVLITGPALGGCPANAVMAYGTARANVRLSDGQIIPEFATVALLTGPLVNGRYGLVVFVNGVRPFGGQLAYAGELRPATGSFGGAFVARLPPIPSLDGIATVALTSMRLAIGSHAIVYRTRRGQRYHPEGVALPERCPRGASASAPKSRLTAADETRPRRSCRARRHGAAGSCQAGVSGRRTPPLRCHRCTPCIWSALLLRSLSASLCGV